MDPPDWGYRSSFSSANILSPKPICFRLDVQLIVHAFCLVFDNTGSSKLARMAMMAITTSNSISVKPRFVYMPPLTSPKRPGFNLFGRRRRPLLAGEYPGGLPGRDRHETRLKPPYRAAS